ncbi:MAG: methyltransferase [Candidatus Micrarchaeota archaeon]|nr:methyltransferase [Candidatus Micrarchaeota archaeon]MDE1804680.1 methyltransferase [Candidatus Micrarchaeota archaeon]
MDELKSVKYGEINVRYYEDVGIGGMDFGQDFIPAVRQNFGKVGSICDFAAGNGFIGFALLANGLCDRLCLTDMNPRAIEACRQTVKENRLEGKVTIYESDGLKDVPASEKWDLVVGNLPHYNGSEEQYRKDIKAIDPDWTIHRQFYRDVSSHLSDRGAVLIVEDLKASRPEMWRKMVEESGLKFVKTFKHRMIRYPGGSAIRSATVSKPPFYKLVIAGIRWAMNPTYPFYFVWSARK